MVLAAPSTGCKRPTPRVGVLVLEARVLVLAAPFHGLKDANARVASVGAGCPVHGVNKANAKV